MFKRFILFAVALTILLATMQAVAYSGLPEAVQAARDFLAQTGQNREVASGLADELLKFCDEYPTSSLVAEAAWLACRLYEQQGKPQDALQAAMRVVASGSASEFVTAAFDYVWERETNRGKNQARAADLARDYAASLANNPRAAEYLRIAFQSCRALNRANDAVIIGKAYVSLKNPPADPVLLLDIGEHALQAADHELAQAVYEQFTARYPALPQTVIAWSRLGDLALSEGKEAVARADYSWGWNAYQKNRKDGAFNQPEVAQAAAHSLWMLLKPRAAEFEQLTAIDSPLNESQARRAGEDLENAYTDVMRTDPNFAPVAFNAIGNLHRRMGDALLKEGFRRNLASRTATTPPYAEAMPEYARALAAYQQASDRAAARETVKQNAAVQAFEVVCGQGDAVFGWAYELQRRAPALSPGSNSTESRLAFYEKTLCPLLETGLNYKSQALALTGTLPVEQYAIHVRESLDLPLRTPLAELAGMLKQQHRTLASSATELGQSFRHGFQPASVGPLIENVERNLVDATTGFGAAEIISRLYAQLQPNLISTSRPFWDELLASTHHSYADACRTLSDQMALAAAHLGRANNAEIAGLVRRITRLSSKGSQEERVALTQWHALAARYPSSSKQGEEMLARLAELDPENYGMDKTHPSASRKKK